MARTVRESEAPVELDRLDALPHPRETVHLFGQDRAEAELLDAYRGGRMHHGWLLHGGEGIGKATLAYRFAKFILAHSDPSADDVKAANDLAVDGEAFAARQVVAQAHPDLHVLRREINPRTRSTPTVISVDQVRGALQFFSMTAGTGGWRILIVDSADELNISAANALLKTLEEPPARSLIMLLANNPGKLLATIRSRCRRLGLEPLGEADLASALEQAGVGPQLQTLDAAARTHFFALAGGSVRQALSLLTDNLLDLYHEVTAMIASADRLDQARVHALAARMARGGSQDRSAVLLDVIERVLAAHIAAAAPGGEPHKLARLAEVWEKTRRLAGDTEVFHFDRKQVILNVFRWIEAASRQP